MTIERIRKPHRTRLASPPRPVSAWMPEWGLCGAGTEKRSYPSRHEAKKDARTIHGTAYRCPLYGCGHYHITHYPPRVNRAIRLLLESLRADVRAGRITQRQFQAAGGHMEPEA